MKRRRGANQDDAVDGSVAADGDAAPERAHPRPSGPRLGELLVERGTLTEEQLANALADQETSEKPLGRILVAQGVLDERGLFGALAEQYGVRVADLRNVVPDPEALSKIDGALARELHALPLEADETHLTVATDHIPPPSVLQRLSDAAGLKVSWMLAPPGELARSIDRAYRALEDVHVYVEAFHTGGGGRPISAAPLIEFDENAPIVQVVSRILTEAVRDRASDIHIEPQEDRLRVRFRVDGALHEPLSLPGSMAQALVSRLKIMADMNIVERRRAQDGQFEFTIDNQKLDVRVATVATIWGEKAVLRILDRSRSVFEMPELGMPSDVSRRFSELIRSPFGMVICAGPTGSGKTTTLYAALNEISDTQLNTMTIEDPVEYVFPDINQIQINEQADITFAGGLKAILRQDPDVILVGEMRDVETARIAVQSALTGHLVLSSIHATDASSAVQRFLDMGIESFLVASSVLAVVGQRLVRRICTHCAVEFEPSPEELAFYEAAGGREKPAFMHGEGCNFCAQTGYADRIGVFELLQISDEIRAHIVQHAPHEKIQATAVEQGMTTLREQGVRLVEQDMTTISEVVRRIYTL